MLNKTLNTIKKIENIILILLMTAIVLTTFMQVLGRFTPIPFTSAFEELAIAAFIWMTMFGSAVCVRAGGHICMDIIASILPKDKVVYTEIWQYLITLIFSVAVVSITLNLIPSVKRAGMVSASLNIPVYFHYYALVIGFALMSFWSVVGIGEQVQTIVLRIRHKKSEGI